MLDKCRGTYGQPQQPHGQPHGVVPGQFEQPSVQIVVPKLTRCRSATCSASQAHGMTSINDRRAVRLRGKHKAQQHLCRLGTYWMQRRL